MCNFNTSKYVGKKIENEFLTGSHFYARSKIVSFFTVLCTCLRIILEKQLKWYWFFLCQEVHKRASWADLLHEGTYEAQTLLRLEMPPHRWFSVDYWRVFNEIYAAENKNGWYLLFLHPRS